MIEFKLPKHKRVRVWVGILPDVRYTPQEWLACTVSTNAPQGRDVTVCVELYVPTGARALYALLGGTFAPAPGDLLTVRVACSDVGKRFPDAMACRVDDVRTGLPREFAEAVLDAVAGSSSLPAGVLAIDHAAYGMVGSSRKFFRDAAGVFVRLIVAPDLGESERELLEIVK